MKGFVCTLAVDAMVSRQAHACVRVDAISAGAAILARFRCALVNVDCTNTIHSAYM